MTKTQSIDLMIYVLLGKLVAKKKNSPHLSVQPRDIEDVVFFHFIFFIKVLRLELWATGTISCWCPGDTESTVCQTQRPDSGIKTDGPYSLSNFRALARSALYGPAAVVAAAASTRRSQRPSGYLWDQTLKRTPSADPWITRCWVWH